MQLSLEPSHYSLSAILGGQRTLSFIACLAVKTGIRADCPSRNEYSVWPQIASLVNYLHGRP